MSVHLATITRSHVHAKWFQSVMAATKENVISNIGLRLHGPYLDAARNLAVTDFLNTDCELLLFVDSDIEFTPDDVRVLVEAIDPGTAPVVGGLYYNPTSATQIKPVAYNWGFDPLLQEDNLIQITDDEITSDLQPVHAVGTGFMMIHRQLIDKMTEVWGFPQPWFAEQVVSRSGETLGIHMGEDMTFCLRVSAMGFPILLARKARLHHFKEVRL